MIEIEIQDDEVQAMLNRLLQKTDDLSDPMSSIANILFNAAEEAFLDEASPFGDPWAELSPVTVAIRTEMGKWPGKKLHLDNALVPSVAPQSGKDYAEVVVGAKHGATHQFGARKGQYGTTKRGAPIPWGDIPARPFLPINKQNELPDHLSEQIIDVLKNYLLDI